MPVTKSNVVVEKEVLKSTNPLPIKKPREVKYPEIMQALCITTSKGDKSLTEEQARKLLGWEDEDQYAKRILKERPNATEEECKYGERYLFKDANGKKVRCLNNDNNRPFTEKWARSIAQDILTRRWAGTTGKPGSTINGENVIIGRTELVISGQHRLIGFVLACQMWYGKNSARWKTLWPEKPRLPTSILFGIDESPDTTRTIDNVRARTQSDIIYTSEIFRDLEDIQRKECSRMLDKAIDLLWSRTGYGLDDPSTEFQTRATAMDFVDRHSKLQECVLHIFKQNSDRSLSVNKLSPGECSALLYLMGSSSTDGDNYREEGRKFESPRSEANVFWNNWDKAVEFFTLLSDTRKDPTLDQIWKVRRPAKGDENHNVYSGYIFTGGDESSTNSERVAVICKAFLYYLNNREFTGDDLRLTYEFELEDDRSVKSFRLNENCSVGGIDLGDPAIWNKKDKEKKESTDTVDEPSTPNKSRKGHLMSNIVPPTPQEIQKNKPSKPPVDESPEEERARREKILNKPKSLIPPVDETTRKRRDETFNRLRATKENTISEEIINKEINELSEDEEPVPMDNSDEEDFSMPGDENFVDESPADELVSDEPVEEQLEQEVSEEEPALTPPPPVQNKPRNIIRK